MSRNELTGPKSLMNALSNTLDEALALFDDYSNVNNVLTGEVYPTESLLAQ